MYIKISTIWSMGDYWVILGLQGINLRWSAHDHFHVFNHELSWLNQHHSTISHNYSMQSSFFFLFQVCKFLAHNTIVWAGKQKSPRYCVWQIMCDINIHSNLSSHAVSLDFIWQSLLNQAKPAFPRTPSSRPGALEIFWWGGGGI